MLVCVGESILPRSCTLGPTVRTLLVDAEASPDKLHQLGTRLWGPSLLAGKALFPMGVYDMDDLEDSEPSDSKASRQWAERYGLPLWREDDSDDDFGGDEWTEPTLRTSTVTSDPYHSNEIHMILQEQSRPPPLRLVPYYLLSRTTTDRFSQLPQELRIAIAIHLPTPDFLNGRLALRGLWDIFDSQQFWATRFRGHEADQSWLFESHHPPGSTRDWRFLYKQTSNAYLSQSSKMRNRRRVWELALRLKPVLSLKPLVLLPPREDETGVGNIEWATAKADICRPPPEQPHRGFVRGCRVLHTQRVRLQAPGSYKKIALSFVQVGEHSYISGLRLDFGNGEDLQIGYQALTEQIVELGSRTWTGIRLAIGPRGMHGLQFITGHNGECSRWYGQTDDLPQTNCLVSQNPIVALEAGLDVGISFSELLSLSH